MVKQVTQSPNIAASGLMAAFPCFANYFGYVLQEMVAADNALGGIPVTQLQLTARVTD